MKPSSPNQPVSVVLRCAQDLSPKVRYVFDTLFMARGIQVTYPQQAPPEGLWILYGPQLEQSEATDRCLPIAHCSDNWALFQRDRDIQSKARIEGLDTVFSESINTFKPPSSIPFDLIANAFFFLSSWSERVGNEAGKNRCLYSNSVFSRLDIAQDIVDQYLSLLITRLEELGNRQGIPVCGARLWPERSEYALVLSHDVDFLPGGFTDNLVQGAKTIVRHLLRQRDPVDAAKAGLGFLRAVATGRDPYGCVAEIVAREKELGVTSSIQVAVGHRHPNDVNYRIEDQNICDYLRVITDNGFDLCLHGSYRSTENPVWYREETELLAQRLGKPLGSRQHFLSFDYDALFNVQEQVGIQYDMSIGYPDRIGARAGFSFPYFPYCFAEDRPYDVLQISLFLMDVTLRSYMNMKGKAANDVIQRSLDDLHSKNGCASVVWHPIVFGGARDPGFDDLFWNIIHYVRENKGYAGDGRAINRFWRDEARHYSSFNRSNSAVQN